MAERFLLILRHAKSDWTPSDPNDHDRPLTKRGRHAAGELAAQILPEERPELILCSSARRALETLAGVSALVGAGTTVSVEHSLYQMEEQGLLAHLRQLPAGTRSVMVIGHNPGLHDLAVRVTGQGDTAVVERLAEGLVSGGLVTMTLGPGGWDALDTGTCRLVRYDLPSA
ncbi:MAG: SixA phosphatase family protein [Acidimicrobiales bacterium]